MTKELKNDLMVLTELQIKKWTNNYQKQTKLEVFFQDEESEIKQFNSPNNKYVSYSNKNKVRDSWEIWIKPIGNGSSGKLVYTCYGYGHVELLWSPDSQHLAINERLGSDGRITTIVTFEHNGVELSVREKHEELSTKVEGEFYRLLGKNKTEEECDHFYMNILTWSPDSSEVLV